MIQILLMFIKTMILITSLRKNGKEMQRSAPVLCQTLCCFHMSCFLCDPVDCSTPGLPVHQQLPESTKPCPSSWWYHPTISSSVVPFSSCLYSFPASRYFPTNQLFTSGGQSIGASASASVIPMDSQDRFPLELMVWSPCNPRDSQESSPIP